MIPGEVAVLAVTPPGRGERMGRAPARRPVPNRSPRRARRGGSAARGRPVPSLGLVVGGGGSGASRRGRDPGHPGLGRRRGAPAPQRWVERDRRPVLGGGPRHPAGRRAGATHRRPVRVRGRRARPRLPTRSSTPRATCAATTTSGWATPSTWRPGRGRHSRRPTCSTTPPRRPRCGWSARCSRSRRRPCSASSCAATGCPSTVPAPSSCSPTPWARDRPRMPMTSPSARPATRSCWPTCPDASRPTCATPPRCSTC